jgi:hypothetical protein
MSGAAYEACSERMSVKKINGNSSYLSPSGPKEFQRTQLKTNALM